MNLLLLRPDDLIGPSRVRISGRRLHHVISVHRADLKDVLSVGMVNGRMGTGCIASLSETAMEMDIELAQDPPEKLPLTVVLALPRPKVLRRMLSGLAVLGARRIVLVNAARVEKSYWQTPFLSEDAVRTRLLLGLEQARDTVLPEVLVRKLFRPFVEDELPGLSRDTLRLAAHPSARKQCARSAHGPVTLAVGPEGGFVPFEIEKLEACGFVPVTLGTRILNVETAVPALIGRLF
jgi:16S rRNA (uracil1498-N3)-methyltransferase